MRTDASPHDPPGREDIVVEPKEKSDGGTSDAAGGDVIQEEEERNTQPAARKFTVPKSLAWIPQNMSWSKLKPVIRCSLAAWVAAVLMIIGPVSRSLGQVGINISLLRFDEG